MPALGVENLQRWRDVSIACFLRFCVSRQVDNLFAGLSQVCLKLFFGDLHRFTVYCTQPTAYLQQIPGPIRSRPHLSLGWGSSSFNGTTSDSICSKDAQQTFAECWIMLDLYGSFGYQKEMRTSHFKKTPWLRHSEDRDASSIMVVKVRSNFPSPSSESGIQTANAWR